MSEYPGTPWPSDSQPYPWTGEDRKPPVVPFQPFNLGTLFDGTFAAIRANPRVMFAVSLGVMAVLGLVGALLSLLIPQPDTEGFTLTTGLPTWTVTSVISEPVFAIVSAVATLLVTGMLVLSVTNAVIGVKLDLGDTWTELKPHFWRLVGATLLVSLIVGAVSVAGVITVILSVGLVAATGSGVAVALVFVLSVAWLVLVIWLGVRLCFTPVVAVVEGASPGASLRRSWILTQNAFWRVLGRELLMTIVVGAASAIIGGTVAMTVTFLGAYAPWWLTSILLALVSALVTGLTLPFSAAYLSLMYVDERFRKENLGPSLQQAFERNLDEQAGQAR